MSATYLENVQLSPAPVRVLQQADTLPSSISDGHVDG